MILKRLCSCFLPKRHQSGHYGPRSLPYAVRKDMNAQVSPSVSGPDLHGHHGLLGADGRKQVLLAQELKRKLDQEAADLLQLLLSPGRVLLVQARLGQVALQLQDVTDVAGRQTAENLKERGRTESGEDQGLVLRNFKHKQQNLLNPNRRQPRFYSDKNKSRTHLLVNGGVASAGGHPDLLVEVVADGIRHVNGGIGVSAQNHPERKTEQDVSERHEETLEAPEWETLHRKLQAAIFANRKQT